MQIKLLVFILFSTLSTIQIFAQRNPINIGERVKIDSKILAEERTVIIGLPPYYDENKKYSVLYLLDGDDDQNRAKTLLEQSLKINPDAEEVKQLLKTLE